MYESERIAVHPLRLCIAHHHHLLLCIEDLFIYGGAYLIAIRVHRLFIDRGRVKRLLV